MRYIDRLVLSQVMPWQPNKKIYKIEELIFWNFIKLTPIRLINFLLDRYGKSPYLPLNDDYKCIYLHIPKNGGISIQTILFHSYSRVGHKSLLHYKLYNKEKFNNYYKFTFVRNPWDRLVSAFHFLVKGGLDSNETNVKIWADQLKIYGINDFENFVLSMTDADFCKTFLSYRHFRPQHLWLIDEHGELAVDFICKIENFDAGMENLKNILGLHTNYTANNHIKRNVTNHDNYKNLYSAKMKKIVEEFYKKDIELFNYDFE